MKRCNLRMIQNQRGIAMVLAVSLIALLSSIGLWLIIESKGTLETSRAFERTEATSHLAEGACWLSVRTLDTQTPALPTTGDHITDITPSETYLVSDQALGSSGRITPQVLSSRTFFNTLPSAGWGINAPSPPYTKYYLSRGKGEVQITKSRGHARSFLYNLVSKESR